MLSFPSTMRSMPLDLLSSAPKTRLQTAIWTAKLAFLLVGIASTAILVRLAVPISRNLLVSTLPRLCVSFRSYLAPPYLFITINFIILTILKLSDKKHHHYHKEQPDAAAAEIPLNPPKDLHPSSPRKPSSMEAWSDAALPPAFSSDVSTEYNVSSPVSSVKTGGSSPENWSDVSCVTTDSVHKPAVSSAVSSRPAGVRKIVERSVKASENASTPVEEEPDSMDATWMAIRGAAPAKRLLRKSDTWEVSPRIKFDPERSEAAKSEAAAAAAPTAGRDLRKSETFNESSTAATTRRVVERRVTGREVVVGVQDDEMNRQFEAFIKKIYDQMRLQRQESEQRYREMVNAGY